MHVNLSCVHSSVVEVPDLYILLNPALSTLPMVQPLKLSDGHGHLVACTTFG